MQRLFKKNLDVLGKCTYADIINLRFQDKEHVKGFPFKCVYLRISLLTLLFCTTHSSSVEEKPGLAQARRPTQAVLRNADLDARSGPSEKT